MGLEERVCSPLLWIAYIRGMHLELTDAQTEALIRELSYSSTANVTPQSTHCGTEGDPGAATDRDTTLTFSFSRWRKRHDFAVALLNH